MRLLRTVALSVALALAGAPATLAAEIQTAAGPATVDGVPRTVAVYDIAAIDSLLRLGVVPDGVPDKLFLDRLSPVAATAAVVGTLFEPDLEALNALGPDLVIVGGRSSTQVDAARRVAPTIDMTIDGTNLLADAKARLTAYGAIFDKAVEAEAAIAEIDAAVAGARAAAAGKGTALILMTNGPKISAYGTGSRFAWIHDALAIPPAVADVEAASHGEAISFEFVREANPDWLIVIDRAAAIGSGEQNASATLDNALVAGTTAWTTGQVIHLPAAEAYIAAGGATATLRVLTTITEAFRARP